MNVLDIILLIVVVGSFLRGFQQGLIRQSINFLGFFAAVFMAYYFSKDLAPYLQDIIPSPNFDQTTTLFLLTENFQVQEMFYNAIAFLVIFIITKLALQVVGGILHQIASLPGLATINRFTGATMGAIQGVLLIIIVVSVISVMPFEAMDQYIVDSSIAQFFLQLLPVFTEMLYNLWNSGAAV